MTQNDFAARRPFFRSIMEICPLCGVDCEQRYVRTVSETEQTYRCDDCGQERPREAWFHVEKTSQADFTGPLV